MKELQFLALLTLDLILQLLEGVPKLIVSGSGLKIRSLKPAEQKACTYDQQPITLDGKMDMKVSFGDKTIITTAYVKLVAPSTHKQSVNEGLQPSDQIW